ncbi:TPA: hypothetical protein QDB13_002498 [Burkholderia vietnamiensis]|nr:hypothetical protein [Burkholderia vietnamiensis]
MWVSRAMSAMRASSVQRFVWANVLGCGDRNEHESRFGGSLSNKAERTGISYPRWGVPNLEASAGSRLFSRRIGVQVLYVACIASLKKLKGEALREPSRELFREAPGESIREPPVSLPGNWR